MLGQGAQRIDHLARTGGAVQSHDVGAAGRDQHGRRERLGAEQHATRRIERDLGDHRDAPSHLFHRLARPEDLRAQLEQVLRRLGDEAVDAAPKQRDRLLPEDLHQLGGPDSPQVRVAGGGQKPARPQRPGDVARPSVVALRPVRFLAGDPRRLLVHLHQPRADVEFVQLGPAPAERIRLHHVAADFQV